MSADTTQKTTSGTTFVERLTQWRAKHFRDIVFAYILAIVIGICAGFCAFLLKWMIGKVTGWLTGGTDTASDRWIYFVIPVAGIVLTGIFVRYVVRMDITHGVSKLIVNLKRQIYKIKARILVSPMLASTLTLGFGGSAGSEGPIAYTGAAIGSNLARIFGLSPQLMMIMIGCGAGAGIAGIFKSPVGGFLFTLEVLRIELSTVSVIAVLVSSIAGAMTAYVLSGCTPDVVFAGIHPFDSDLILLFIALGIFCGIYSLYYSAVMKRMQKAYLAIKNPWIRNISGGMVLGAAILLFPSLYGEGYDVIAKMLATDYAAVASGSLWERFVDHPWSIIFMCAGIIMIKCFAASASNSSGGVAGDFAPTLFAGCFAGLFFALIINHLYPEAQLPAEEFAFVGMGGVMAGAIRAPLMALFLTVEMTGCYSLFLPVLIVCGISSVIVWLFSRRDFYARSLNIFEKFH